MPAILHVTHVIDENTYIPTTAEVQHLVVHAVDPIWPQQTDGLANEIGPPTVEHPKAQVEMEFICGSFGVQTLEGAEAAFRPDEDRVRS